MSSKNPRPTVAFVTYSGQPLLYAEEAELPALLAARGVQAEPVVWSDPSVEWKRFDAVVIRSTWDYFERFEEFRPWLDRTESLGIPLFNSADLVRWNFDKRYLRELESRGIRIVPTVFLESRQRADLGEILSAHDWSRAVIKPTISGGAYRTHRLEASEAATYQLHLETILESCGALVQPFFPEIVSEGEWSLVFFDGAFSHAVLKVPAPAEYRIQPHFGGRAERVEPEPWMLDQAREVLAALPEAPAYARIDGLRRGREFFLMEAELIEPYLFLATAPGASARYADLVERLAR
ncbi:MAG: hypothetical protein ABI054_06595 [Planctomycetota bacterium]